MLLLAMAFLVSIAAVSWMISRTSDEHDCCSSENDATTAIGSVSSAAAAGLNPYQSTENQKNSCYLDSLKIGGSWSDGKEAGLNFTPRSVLDDQFLNLNECLEQNSDTRMPNRKLFEWGLLDPKEDEPGELRILPKIEVDVWKSTGSVFTFGSDELIMENLEAELFEDFGASIEKLSKGLPATNYTCKATTHETQASSSFQTAHVSSQSQNRQPAFRQRSGTSKPLKNQILRRQGTNRALKQDDEHSHVKQVKSAVRRGDLKLTLSKRPQIIKTAKSNPTITVKKLTYVDDRESHALKKSMVSGAPRVLTKSASFSKASSSDSAISIQSPPSSFTDCRGSPFSEKDFKSHLASIFRKVDHQKVTSPFSHSTFKTPSKDSTWKRTSSGNSPALPYLTSSKDASSVSPYSSISEWSSSSPLSTTSSDTCSCRSSGYSSFDNAFNEHYNRQRMRNHEFYRILKSSLPLAPTIASPQYCPAKESHSDLLGSIGGSTSHATNATLIPQGYQNDQLKDLSKSLQPSRTTRQVKTHLRDSFEWDSSFFTSAGLLDPEELSWLINGADLSEKKTSTGQCMITSHLNDHLSCPLPTNPEDKKMATPDANIRKSLAHGAATSPSALRTPSPKFGFFDWLV